MWSKKEHIRRTERRETHKEAGGKKNISKEIGGAWPRGVSKPKSRSHGSQGSRCLQEEMSSAVPDSPPRSGVASTPHLTKEMSLSITEGNTGREKPSHSGEGSMSHRRDPPFAESAGNEVMTDSDINLSAGSWRRKSLLTSVFAMNLTQNKWNLATEGLGGGGGTRTLVSQGLHTTNLPLTHAADGDIVSQVVLSVALEDPG